MAEKVYLGIDLGAESGRVTAGLFDGAKIRLQELHRFPNTPVEIAETLRWDVPRLWHEIQLGLALAASTYGNAVISVGVDTWGVDYVLFSKSGELLGLPFHYRDRRNDGVKERADVIDPSNQRWTSTGIQDLPFNTLYQFMASRERTPELLERADQFLMIPDFFHWCLCGSTAVEFTNATTTQFHNPVTKGWAYDLLRQFDVPTQMLGEIVPPGTRLGTLRKSVQARSGLGPIRVVAPGTHDTASAVAAVPTMGTGKRNWAYISSGTWSLVGVEAAGPDLSEACSSHHFTNEGGVEGTYRLLKNVMGLWLVQRCKAGFEAAGFDCGYEQLMTLAAEAEPHRSLIDPDDARFLNPSDMLSEIAGYCRQSNQPVPESPGQFVRCCLESLARKYAVVVRHLQELSPCNIECLHVVGGGSRNRLLNQLTADAAGKPVYAGPVEATVLGNVLVQAVSAGDVHSLSQIRALVRDSFPTVAVYPSDSGSM
jgi:rhamnulokinase